jgi:hypothetical protein
MMRKSVHRPRDEAAARGVRRSAGILAAALLATVLTGNSAAAPAAACDMRLSVELTPDVPNPLDPGFLSSLLSNQVSYRLTLLDARPGSVIVIDLTGPGPEYLCRNVVAAMRKDARVLSIHLDREPLSSLHLQNLQQPVLSLDLDRAEDATIAAAPLLPEESRELHPASGGFAALYWAAHHPTQAWRVFLPGETT